MGQLTSKIESFNAISEYFMILYLTLTGPTPYNMKLLPGGQIDPEDSSEAVRQKFRAAIKRQKKLKKAIKMTHDGVARCLSPCLLANFTLPGPAGLQDQNQNMYSYSWRNEYRTRSKSKTNQPRSRPSAEPYKRDGFGALEKLVVPAPREIGEEMWGAFEGTKTNAFSRQANREKRTRSRPEPASRSASKSKRQAKSASTIRDGLTPIQEASSEILVETIQLNKKSKKPWPSCQVIKNALKNDKPSSLLLARFRRSSKESEFIEVEYRHYKETENDSFQCKGNLEAFLNNEGRLRYQTDKINNNLDEKAIFFENAHYLFNNLEGRIWWNGFTITIDGSLTNRMKLKGLEMDPPAFVFDMTGLRNISATRNFSKLNVVGTAGGAGDELNEPPRKFSLRGSMEQDVKQLSIEHEKGTMNVRLLMPSLSGVPAPMSKEEAKN